MIVQISICGRIFTSRRSRKKFKVSETMCNETKLRYSLMNWTDRQDLSTTRKWKLQFKRTHRQIKLSTVFSPRWAIYKVLLKRHKTSPNEWGVQRLGGGKLIPNGGWRFESQESNRPASQKSFGKTRGSSLTDNRTWVQSSATMHHVASHSVICMCLVI